ncbi:GDP-mannose 6-dehydrogenase [Alcanivorax hongdengensis A-11-3]|uniref:UDP-glucose 6-dehydrogenase n=1 Tax=Alcanivorax hongdengensis A-11-3 TaxID=1177179 RepID=L0WBP8_9GAMM|nr:UDP-glucose/GDP-mannose dehydrogenase family protein [Alcanivorax hongdengensis]EKF74399.1 GDP-mannose 6-dehydrogenase [Alcanivorax hongdengensis A-11-3]
MSTIAILGLGYVGAVCAACFSKRGHHVIGVDVDAAKVAKLGRGEAPIVEHKLSDYLQQAVANGLLTATTDAEAAVRDADMTFICVGTPSNSAGELETGYLQAACQSVGQALRDKPAGHLVVVRSTVLPGTVRQLLLPIIEACSGKRAGRDFLLTMNPEFLRESTAINDFFQPPMTVIGAHSEAAAEELAKLYAGLDAPIIPMQLEEAELVKYACNAWHATKISFANEIGNIAKQAGVDGRRVMDVICQDNKLNLSNYYMKPGFAYGGSCLPKDVRALNAWCQGAALPAPLLASLSGSNANQVQRALAMVRQAGVRKIGMLGLSFKPGTDDLRESPLVELASRLLADGFELTIYDSNVAYAAEHSPVADQLWATYQPLLQRLVASVEQLVDASEAVIMGHAIPEFRVVADTLNSGRLLIDLCGYLPGISQGDRQGICW